MLFSVRLSPRTVGKITKNKWDKGFWVKNLPKKFIFSCFEWCAFLLDEVVECVGTDASSAQSAHLGKVGKEVVGGTIPCVPTDVGESIQAFFELDATLGIDNGEEMLAVSGLYGENQTLNSLSLNSWLPSAGILPDGDFPSIFAVEVIHHAAKDDAVGGCVLQPCIGDGIVDHLMKEYVLHLPLCHGVIGGDTDGIVAGSVAFPGEFAPAGEGAESRFGSREHEPWQRESTTEVIAVEALEGLDEVVDGQGEEDLAFWDVTIHDD